MVLENPTWRTLAKHASQSILFSLNYHHVFFEGISLKHILPDGTKVFTFSMGS